MKKRTQKVLKIIFCVLLILMLIIPIILPAVSRAAGESDIIFVTTTAELQEAMKNANPGDEIVIASGTYTGKLGIKYSGFGSAYFNSDMSGTKENPIILRSEDPQNPVTLMGERTGTGYAIRITGDYWIIENINFGTSQKGIILDNANYNVIKNCKVDNVGQEGIHLRDNSSYNLVENCTVTNTGLQSAGFGEGVYVGSANGSWNEYGKACDYNAIRSCNIGPGVSAEHFDIKEGTTGTVIEDCIMNGTGISGANYADSFIDLKGDNAIVRGNTCYRNNNSVIVDAFQLHNQIDLWGQGNEISGNTVYMDIESGYVINATHDTSAKTCGNTRVPQGQMYTGDVTEYTAPDDLTDVKITEVIDNYGEFIVKTEGGSGKTLYSCYMLKDGKVYKKIVRQESNVLYTSVPNERGTFQIRIYAEDSVTKSKDVNSFYIEIK